MCSPYLTGSLGILLCLVTFYYWSVSTENSGLVKEVQEMELQLHKKTKNIENLEMETKEVRTQLQTYKDRVIEEKELKNKVEVKLKYLIIERDTLKKRLDALIVLKSEGDEKEREQRKSLDSLRYKLKEVKGELISVRTNLSRCNAEGASEITEKDARTADVQYEAGIPPSSDSLGPGQLDDIHPRAVSVIKKGTQGMLSRKDKSGNWLPILPPGDPSMPRAKPRFSVMDLVATKSVEKQTLLKSDPSVQEPERTEYVGKLVNRMAISPSSKVEVTRFPSRGGPTSTSPSGQVKDKLESHKQKKVVNEAGVMPLPSPMRTGSGKVGSRQIDKTVDVNKKQYLEDTSHEITKDTSEGTKLIKKRSKSKSKNSLEDGHDGDTFEDRN